MVGASSTQSFDHLIAPAIRGTGVTEYFAGVARISQP